MSGSSSKSNCVMTRNVCGLAVLLAACACAAAADDSAAIEVVLERLRDEWKPVDPRTVLDSGDRIRFRFSAGEAGWLYVYAVGSGGGAGWLLPKTAAEPGHRVEAGSQYRIPASPGSYSISGPEGFDVLYWILAPRPLPAGTVLPRPAARPVENTLRPRCRTGTEPVLACVDERAGPAPVTAMKTGLKARELKIESGADAVRIEPVDRAAGIIIYEFRLAHRGGSR
jgi:hypothetical protein